MAIPSLELTITFISTIAIYSYILYKENPVYKFAEATMIGIALANASYMAIQSLSKSGIQSFTAGNYLLIIPLLMGPLFFLQHAPKPYVRLAQWPISVLTGIGLAVAIRGSGHTYIYNQVKACFVPLTLNNAIIVLGVILSLFYFVYTIDVSSNHTVRRIHNFGRYAIMIYLGAMFGSVTMTRLTYISGILEPVAEFIKILFGM